MNFNDIKFFIIRDYASIYYIQNNTNHRIYIGRSIHTKKRWDEHKYLLRKNIHFNYKLQKDWNFYGEESFSFGNIITLGIDKISLLSLADLEQDSIDRLNPYYNIARIVDGVIIRECKRKFFILKPNGEEIYCDNLNRFCNEYGLFYGNLRKCALEKIHSHKGYRCRFIENDSYVFNKKERTKFATKKYIIRFPDGHEEIIENLSKFAKQNNLEVSGLRHVLNGKNSHSNGFKIRYLKETNFRYKNKRENCNSKNYVVRYNGKVFHIKNLNKFCIENRLNYRSLRKNCLKLNKEYKGYFVEKYEK